MNMLYVIEDVVLYCQDMCLLECIMQWDQDVIEVELVVFEVGLFVEDDQVLVWVGIEYMVQVIVVWVGCCVCVVDRLLQLGFLFGSCCYSSVCSSFFSGMWLCVQVCCELLGDNGLGMFVCCILVGEEEWVIVNVLVFELVDVMVYLESGQV